MNELLVHTKTESPIGEMYIVATSKGICLLEFDIRVDWNEELEFLKNHFDASLSSGENRHTLELKRQLREYFLGKRKIFSVPLIFVGTDFQIKVWQALKTVPYGTTRTYKEQAISFGDVKAIRAIARANALNKLAIIIPCHRIIGTDGKLTGYAGGIERKRFLLNLERGKEGPKDLFNS